MAKLRRLVRGHRTVREDRLSALSDDLIGLIVSRLDTRTALSTAVLSRRWARIPRQLPALDFRVSNILPLEYEQIVDLRERDLPRTAGSMHAGWLTVGNRTLPPLETYEALTTLVLQDVAASTPVAVYERLFHDCARLEVLHLISCGCAEELDHLVVDAPGSAIRELLVEECAFSEITLRSLPMLARLACLGRTVMLSFGSVPSLTHVNLTFWENEEPLDFLGNAPAATSNLVLRFTGPSRWVLPIHLTTPFLGLKRLLVADLPSNWDVSWPRILLLSARSLEVLHIHVAHSDEEPGEGIGWWHVRKLRHRHMKELVMIGFTPTPRQILFVKDALSVCKCLQRLVLLRDGHVQYNGLWDWEMVGQTECSWSADDRMAVTKLIKSASKPLVDVILG